MEIALLLFALLLFALLPFALQNVQFWKVGSERIAVYLIWK